jgi:hypothetical protein
MLGHDAPPTCVRTGPGAAARTPRG